MYLQYCTNLYAKSLILTFLFPLLFLSAEACLLSTTGWSCVVGVSLPSTVARPIGAMGGETGETGSSDESRDVIIVTSKSCEAST